MSSAPSQFGSYVSYLLSDNKSDNTSVPDKQYQVVTLDSEPEHSAYFRFWRRMPHRQTLHTAFTFWLRFSQRETVSDAFTHWRGFRNLQKEHKRELEERKFLISVDGAGVGYCNSFEEAQKKMGKIACYLWTNCDNSNNTYIAAPNDHGDEVHILAQSRLFLLRYTQVLHRLKITLLKRI